MASRRFLIAGIAAGVAVAIVAGVVAYSLSLGSSPLAAQSEAEIQVLAPESRPYGQSYSQWSVEWWQWLASIPESDNPAGDLTGAKCHVNQDNENVWYFTGTYGGAANRTCEVPSGKSIFYPIVNSLCSFALYPELKTEQELLDCAKADMELVTIKETRINGVPVENLDDFLIQSEFFELTHTEGNIFGLPAGTKTKAVDVGYYVMTEPLPPGQHEITFKAVETVPGSPTPKFALDVKYTINVT